MTSPIAEHAPVLVDAVLSHSAFKPGDVVLDGTIGLGGHARAILPRIAPGGVYIGLDLDADMLAIARQRTAPFESMMRLKHLNFADFDAALVEFGLANVDHMLVDLGLNSAQIEDASRGFSFDRDGPLDMRFDASRGRCALDLVNGLSENELSDILYEYGQEDLSRKIARRICQVRRASRIQSTHVLAQAVESAVRTSGRAPRGRIHPATRVFQALRIAVNDELGNLERFLSKSAAHLRVGGSLSVISFHSLEDAIVKRFLRAGKASGAFDELTRRPIVADEAERESNPRSRSAKLRVGRKL